MTMRALPPADSSSPTHGSEPARAESAKPKPADTLQHGPHGKLVYDLCDEKSLLGKPDAAPASAQPARRMSTMTGRVSNQSTSRASSSPSATSEARDPWQGIWHPPSAEYQQQHEEATVELKWAEHEQTPTATRGGSSMMAGGRGIHPGNSASIYASSPTSHRPVAVPKYGSPYPWSCESVFSTASTETSSALGTCAQHLSESPPSSPQLFAHTIPAELDSVESERARVRQQKHVAGLETQKKRVEDEFQHKWMDIAKREVQAALKPSSDAEDFQAERVRVKADFNQHMTALQALDDVCLQDAVSQEGSTREQREAPYPMQPRLMHHVQRSRIAQEREEQHEMLVDGAPSRLLIALSCAASRATTYPTFNWGGNPALTRTGTQHRSHDLPTIHIQRWNPTLRRSWEEHCQCQNYIVGPEKVGPGGYSAPQPMSLPPRQGNRLTVKPFLGNETVEVELLDGVHASRGATFIRLGTLVRNGETLLVALKEFYYHIQDDDRELLRREVANVAKLASDNRCKYIMPYIGTTVHHDRTFIVSQYMTEGNMLNYLPCSTAANRHKLVAAAVYFLHTDANLVHGDLKCENVLISGAGDALLADFGLSTAAEKGAESQTTRTGIRVRATIRFAAPEILAGQQTPVEPAGARTRPRSKTRASDAYAFGMLVLQGLTGRKPWPHIMEETEVILSVAGYRLVHPRPAENDGSLELISDSVWEICLECWRVDPRKRPSMEWIQENLQKCLH